MTKASLKCTSGTPYRNDSKNRTKKNSEVSFRKLNTLQYTSIQTDVYINIKSKEQAMQHN